MIKRGFAASVIVAVTFFICGASASIQKDAVSSSDYLLKDALSSAPLVIVGEVTIVSTAPFHQEQLSEHDPYWQIGVIKIKGILKNSKNSHFRTKEVYVVFPLSDDVMWAKSPRLSVGQKAIFILEYFDNPVRPGKYYWASNSIQIQPVSQLKKVRKLLK